MNAILVYCFLLGLLHGIVPDEHTWPITFSYAIGSGSGWQGMKRGIYFAGAFTIQRMLMSELAYLALAPFLRKPSVNVAVYILVGVAMSVAGWLLLRRERYGHVHLIGHHHECSEEMERSGAVLGRHHTPCDEARMLPARWTLVHGFIAGFSIGGFGMFVNAVAAPAMPSVWTGMLPGLLFGLGTVGTLAIIGAIFAVGLPAITRLKRQDVQRFGTLAGALMLFAGGFVYAAAGILMGFGIGSRVHMDIGYIVIGFFVFAVAVPALIYAWRQTQPRQSPEALQAGSASHPRNAGS